MPGKPKVVAFDMFGTTFSLEPLREKITSLGLPGSALELWFASGLRDAFALAASNHFEPFKALLDSALGQILAQHRLTPAPSARSDVLDGMMELPPHPDAAEAFQILADNGIRVLALSNGSSETMQALLDKAGLLSLVERVVSVDDVQFSKPRPEVYRYAAQIAHVEPGELALIASHAWDIHGAKAAGLMAGYVARGKPFPLVMIEPDVKGESLGDVARLLTRISG